MSDSYLGLPGNHLGKIFDKELELVPEGTNMTDATGTSPLFIGKGLLDADLVIDLTTVTGSCSLTLEFSDVEDFSTKIAGSAISLTAGQTGRVIMSFRNDPVGTPLAYVRIMPTVGTALVLGAFIGKK